MKSKNRYFDIFIYSLSVTILSGILHFLGYFTFAIGYFVLIIDIPVFISFLIFFIYAGSSKLLFSVIFDNCNKLLFAVGILFIFYGFVSFFLNSNLLDHGSGIVKNGHYFLENRGSIVKEIDLMTYRVLRFAEYRLFTGHAFTFSIVPTVYFSSRYKIKIALKNPAEK